MILLSNMANIDMMSAYWSSPRVNQWLEKAHLNSPELHKSTYRKQVGSHIQNSVYTHSSGDLTSCYDLKKKKSFYAISYEWWSFLNDRHRKLDFSLVTLAGHTGCHPAGFSEQHNCTNNICKRKAEKKHYQMCISTVGLPYQKV